MAMRNLSQGSTKTLILLLVDKNQEPIKADSLHLKGYVYTVAGGVKHEFEINMGAVTGCEIKDTENYTVQIDVKTGAIKIIKK